MGLDGQGKMSKSKGNAIGLFEDRDVFWNKLRGAFTQNPFAKDEKKLTIAITYAGNQDLLDTLWGYYFATGSHVPIERIIRLKIESALAPITTYFPSLHG